MCYQFTHSPCDDCEHINTLFYYHHQIEGMNYYPLFRVMSWNNDARCISFCILMCDGTNSFANNLKLSFPFPLPYTYHSLESNMCYDKANSGLFSRISRHEIKFDISYFTHTHIWPDIQWYECNTHGAVTEIDRAWWNILWHHLIMSIAATVDLGLVYSENLWGHVSYLSG